MKKAIFILTIAVALLYSCNNSNKKESENTKETENQEQSNEITPKTETSQTTNSIDFAIFESDTIVVTASAKGKRMRLSMLQQKALFMAKKKLADSIAVLNKQIDSINSDGSKTYREIVLRDIHIKKEWFGYPNPADKSIIEAYITVGMENRPN